MITDRLSLLLVVLVGSHVAYAEDASESKTISTNEDRCTLEQKTDLVLLGLSLDEVNEKCGASGDKESQATANNNTRTPSANYSQPVFVHRHGPENFLFKLGVSLQSTSFLNDECSDCGINDVGVDLFSFRYYSNSIQPDSVGIHFHLNHILPEFYAEYENVDVYTPADDGSGSVYRGNYSYSVEYLNTAHYIGLEYIFGNDAASFYPGVAVLFGSLSQYMLIDDCTEAGGGDSTYAEDSYCWDDLDDGHQELAMKGLSITLYSDRIAKKGAGISVGLTHFIFGDDGDEDERAINFATTGVEISGIW